MVVKPRRLVLGELGPFAEVGVNLQTSKVYREMAKIREWWTISSRDLQNNEYAQSLCAQMRSYTNLDSAEFEKMLYRIAWLGDLKSVSEHEETTTENLEEKKEKVL